MAMFRNEIRHRLKDAYTNVMGENPSKVALTNNPSALAREARSRVKNQQLKDQITTAKAKEFLDSYPTAQIHKQIRKHFVRSVVYAKCADNVWQTGEYSHCYRRENLIK